MSVLTLLGRPINEQIDCLERGLASNTLAKIARLLGLPKARIVEGLDLVQRTVTAREKSRTRFSANESERIYRLVRVYALARQIFTSDKAVAEWVTVPDRSLGGRAPLQMLTTDLGAQKVERLLRAMMHGVPL